jgi:hypothetical protein
MTQHEFGRATTGTTGSDQLATSARQQADQARREAGSVAEEVRGAARDAMGEARRAGEVIKNEATGLAGSVKQHVAAQAEAQKDGVAERVASVAQQFHGAADGLRDREAWLADLVDRGARELDGFAQELRQRDVRSILGGVESLAHRHPALFMGTAVALGFALTRMVRGGAADTARSYHDDYASQRPSYQPGTGAYAGSYAEGAGSRSDVGTSSVGAGHLGASTSPTGGTPGSVSDPASPGAIRGSNI